MLTPPPFVVANSGEAEEAPEGAIPINLYGAGTGGGGAGEPIDLDASDTVIGRGHLEAAAGIVFPFEIYVSESGNLRTRVNIGTSEEPNWTDMNYPYIPTNPDYDEQVSIEYYGGVIEEYMAGYPKLYNGRVFFETTSLNGGSFQAIAEKKLAQGEENRSYFRVTNDGVEMGALVRDGSPSSTEKAYRIEVNTGTLRGIHAHDYSGENLPDYSGGTPYIGDYDSSVITLAALRKYVEDTIGYGEPGQVLATNSTGDGYEWIDRETP